jgi:pimeloyl-ACP methyl ester carboxylesterase
MQEPQQFHHNTFQHAGVRTHYVTAGTAPGAGGSGRTLVLVHGWPQTWREFRLIMGPLADDGWFVVAPDVRGAGGSSKPEGGYDKQTMARDLKALLDHLGVTNPVTLFGHDLGMLVAYAYATLYPDDVERLVVAEAPIPGTKVYENVLATTEFSTSPLWHFHFHGAPDNAAEQLIAGNEFAYIRSFYVKLSANPDAIPISEAEHYVADYTAPGAMRAGIELFRAFEKDAQDNQRVLAQKGKLTLPVLAIGGTASFFLPVAQEMLSEVAEDVTVQPIEESGHWLAEEQPGKVLERLREFTQAPRAAA